MQVSPENPLKRSKFRLADRSYAESVRLIGQTLVRIRPEFMFKPEFLEIQFSEGVYQLRGIATIFRQQASLSASKHRFQKVLARFSSKHVETAKPSSAGVFTLRYTAEEIAYLDKEWKAKREKVGKIPDIQGLPELLRTVGSDLDGSGNSLLKITREGEKLVVLFQDRDGNTGTREYGLSFLYRKQQEMASDRICRAALEPWKDCDL